MASTLIQRCPSDPRLTLRCASDPRMAQSCVGQDKCPFCIGGSVPDQLAFTSSGITTCFGCRTDEPPALPSTNLTLLSGAVNTTGLMTRDVATPCLWLKTIGVVRERWYTGPNCQQLAGESTWNLTIMLIAFSAASHFCGIGKWLDGAWHWPMFFFSYGIPAGKCKGFTAQNQLAGCGSGDGNKRGVSGAVTIDVP